MPVATAKSSFQALAALETETLKHEQAAKSGRETMAKMFRDLARDFDITPKAIAAAAAKPEKLARAPRKAKGKQVIPVKYRHKDDPSLTWTGRGREPRWLAALTSKGAKREDFRIGA